MSEVLSECPVCMDVLDNMDLSFRPCKCGYQMCRLCWNRISDDRNGRCPQCRQPYKTENYTKFTPPNYTEHAADTLVQGDIDKNNRQAQRMQVAKKAKDREKKHTEASVRKKLGNVRVIQRNLVYVTNLALSAATEEILKRDYFGRFGKIKKVVVNRNNVYQGPQGPSVCAYITYFRPKDAHEAIKAVDGTVLDGRLLRASFGTTKYCSYFLRNVRCPNPECMYLHELGADVDSFTKEDMAQGKHLLSNVSLRDVDDEDNGDLGDYEYNSNSLSHRKNELSRSGPILPKPKQPAAWKTVSTGAPSLVSESGISMGNSSATTNTNSSFAPSPLLTASSPSSISSPLNPEEWPDPLSVKDTKITPKKNKISSTATGPMRISSPSSTSTSSSTSSPASISHFHISTGQQHAMEVFSEDDISDEVDSPRDYNNSNGSASNKSNYRDDAALENGFESQNGVDLNNPHYASANGWMSNSEEELPKTRESLDYRQYNSPSAYSYSVKNGVYGNTPLDNSNIPIDSNAPKARKNHVTPKKQTEWRKIQTKPQPGSQVQTSSQLQGQALAFSSSPSGISNSSSISQNQILSQSLPNSLGSDLHLSDDEPIVGKIPTAGSSSISSVSGGSILSGSANKGKGLGLNLGLSVGGNLSIGVNSQNNSKHFSPVGSFNDDSFDPLLDTHDIGNMRYNDSESSLIPDFRLSSEKVSKPRDIPSSSSFSGEDNFRPPRISADSTQYFQRYTQTAGTEFSLESTDTGSGPSSWSTQHSPYYSSAPLSFGSPINKNSSLSSSAPEFGDNPEIPGFDDWLRVRFTDLLLGEHSSQGPNSEEARTTTKPPKIPPETLWTESLPPIFSSSPATKSRFNFARDEGDDNSRQHNTFLPVNLFGYESAEQVPKELSSSAPSQQSPATLSSHSHPGTGRVNNSTVLNNIRQNLASENVDAQDQAVFTNVNSNTRTVVHATQNSRNNSKASQRANVPFQSQNQAFAFDNSSSSWQGVSSPNYSSPSKSNKTAPMHIQQQLSPSKPRGGMWSAPASPTYHNHNTTSGFWSAPTYVPHSQPTLHTHNEKQPTNSKQF